MTSNFLKIIAVIAMFVDHFGIIGWSPPSEAYYIMRKIGRIAFVTYAFLVCVAMYNTRKPLLYVVRMLILALVYQAFVMIVNVWTKFSDPYYLNIFFVIFFGALTIYAMGKHWLIGLAVFIAIIAIYFIYVNTNSIFKVNYIHFFTIDYTLYGYLIISGMGFAFYFQKKMPIIVLKLILITGFVVINIFFYNLSFTDDYLARIWNIGRVQIYSLWALPLFLFYNPRDHYKNSYIKWAFVSAYPLSFIVPTIIFTIL